MQGSIVLVLVAVLVVVSGVPAPQNGKYTTKYDAVNVDQILDNDRLFKQYINCLLTDVGCTPDATELKKVLPEALNNDCARCSDVQRATAEKVFTFIYNNKKDVFDKLAEKFDPKGEHREKYSRFAADKGIKF